jgi:hypothetical protein
LLRAASLRGPSIEHPDATDARSNRGREGGQRMDVKMRVGHGFS